MWRLITKMDIYQISHNIFVWTNKGYRKIEKGSFYVVSDFGLYPILIEDNKTRMDVDERLPGLRHLSRKIEDEDEKVRILGIIMSDITSNLGKERDQEELSI